MFNIVAGRRGDAQAVFIRAAEPLDGWKADLWGPGKLARGLKITRLQNGLDLTGSILFVCGNMEYQPCIRVGMEYSTEWSTRKNGRMPFFGFSMTKVRRFPNLVTLNPERGGE